MEVKCTCRHILSKERFSLFMLLPFLLGLMASPTHAEWDTRDDPLLLQSPKKQGWILVGQGPLPPLLKPPETSLKTASR